MLISVEAIIFLEGSVGLFLYLLATPYWLVTAFTCYQYISTSSFTVLSLAGRIFFSLTLAISHFLQPTHRSCRERIGQERK